MTEANEPSGVFVEYDPERDVYTGSLEDAGTAPSMAVVEAIADVTNRDPMDLEPLYRSVDTDALDSLVGNARHSNVAVSFGVEDFAVCVHGDRTIEIRPPESAHE